MAGYLTADAMPSESAAYLAETNTTKILTTAGVWCFIAVVVVLLRLYVRARMLRYVGPDDITMGITMVRSILVHLAGDKSY